jgi:hypothetical protein
LQMCSGVVHISQTFCMEAFMCAVIFIMLQNYQNKNEIFAPSYLELP